MNLSENIIPIELSHIWVFFLNKVIFFISIKLCLCFFMFLSLT